MTDTNDFEKMERDGWAKPEIAQGYADGFKMATEHVAQALSDAVEAGPNTRVLDLCTGHGVVAAALLARGADVIGLDFSAAMISLAQRAAPGATFMKGDATATGFSDHSFDAVTIGFGVPHFPNPAHGLSEAARILRPGGRLAFSIWHGKGSAGAFGWLFDAVGRLGDPTVTLPAGPDAHMLVERAIAVLMLTDAGFVDVEITEIATELVVQTPEALFDVFDQGAVRAASLLGSQPVAQRDVIRADLAARTASEGIACAEGYRVPAPCVIVSAVRG